MRQEEEKVKYRKVVREGTDLVKEDIKQDCYYNKQPLYKCTITALKVSSKYNSNH